MTSDSKLTAQVPFSKIESEYVPNEEDTDLIRDLKVKIQRLPEHQRRIFLMYVDMGSYSAVARELNCSAPTVAKYIKQIIIQITDNQ